MKNKYVKPSIIIESFTLLEHIAGPCQPDTTPATYRDGDSCVYTDSKFGFVMFNDNNAACVAGMSEITYDEMSYDSLQDFINQIKGCYNAFQAPGSMAFAS